MQWLSESISIVVVDHSRDFVSSKSPNAKCSLLPEFMVYVGIISVKKIQAPEYMQSFWELYVEAMAASNVVSRCNRSSDCGRYKQRMISVEVV